jgi:hypothetical protein
MQAEPQPEVLRRKIAPKRDVSHRVGESPSGGDGSGGGG